MVAAFADFIGGKAFASSGTDVQVLQTASSIEVLAVSTYKTRILEKMQMPHEAALVRYAMRHKLFDEGEDI